MTILGLPVYEATMTDDEISGMVAISLVEEAAVERNFQTFANEKKPELFKSEPSQHIITGVAIRADYPIYRNGFEDVPDHYLVFRKDTIKQMVEKYSKEKLWNTVNLQHNKRLVDGVYMVEMYLKDVERNINPAGFEDIENGSLFVTFKVENNEIWNEIVNGNTLNGFSIECFQTQVLTDDYSSQSTSIIDYLLSDKKKVEFASVGSLLTKAMENREVINLTIKGNSTIQDAQIYQLAKQDGQNVIILYGRSQQYPDSRQWYIYKASDITNVKPSNAQFIDWVNARRGAGYEAIQDMLDVESIETIRSAVAPRDEIDRAIDERRVCIINYRDASQENCTGARQVLVCERGVNRAGNAALRAYQYFGANHSESEGWKQFLLGRILSFEIVEFMQPVDIAPPGYNPATSERDGFNSQKWSIFPN